VEIVPFAVFDKLLPESGKIGIDGFENFYLVPVGVISTVIVVKSDGTPFVHGPVKAAPALF
jgi:hypothetical protein